MYLEHYDRDLVCEKCIVDYPHIHRRPRVLADDEIPQDCPETHPLFGEQCMLWLPHQGLCVASHMRPDQVWIELKWSVSSE